MKREIEFFKPQKTLPISTTGQTCSLDCAHCGGHFLKAMVPIDTAFEEIRKRQSKSCLISGGCDSKGKVIMNPSALESVAQLKNNCIINMHTGMLEDSEIEEVCRLAHVISLDIPVSAKVIKEVYGLKYELKDYINLYRKLSRRIKVVPHICLGLADSPELEEEGALLDEIAVIKPERLCYIIFTPVAGTRFENRKPPEILLVEKVFKRTSEIMPDTLILLGCMRPRGEYRDAVDVKAVETGVHGIVMPSRKAVERAEELGIKIIWKDECCAF